MKENQEPACPRDRVPLAWNEGRGFGCRKCGGFFVDEKALARALGHSPFPRDDAGARLGALPAGAVACPGCATATRQLVHKGVEIDICPACHGFWLDAGEWERIARPASTRGSKFGLTVPVAGAAAATAVAATAVGVAGAAAAASPAASAQSGAVAQVVEVIADGAGSVVVEVVFEFIGEALGSLF